MQPGTARHVPTRGRAGCVRRAIIPLQRATHRVVWVRLSALDVREHEYYLKWSGFGDAFRSGVRPLDNLFAGAVR